MNNQTKEIDKNWKEDLVDRYKDIPAGVMAMLIVDIEEKIKALEEKHKKKIEEMIEEEKRIAKGIKEIKQQVEEIVNKVK